MIWSGELKLRTGATQKIHAVLVHSAPRPLFLRRSLVRRWAASEKLHPARLESRRGSVPHGQANWVKFQRFSPRVVFGFSFNFLRLNQAHRSAPKSAPTLVHP